MKKLNMQKTVAERLHYFPTLVLEMRFVEVIEIV
jgi:hypothetical protein